MNFEIEPVKVSNANLGIVVEPQKKYAILGALVMEMLDLIIDPRGMEIYPTYPRSKLPMAEVE